MNQVKIREEALSEALHYLENNIGIPDILEENYDDISTMHELLTEIVQVCHASEDEMDEENKIFRDHVRKHLVIGHGKYYTLPTPVFSYTKPSSGVQFLLHIMISLGSFDTEIDLTLHNSIRDSLRYAKLIGPSDNPEDLASYSNDLMTRHFKEQIVTFSNSKNVLQSWIVQAAELFDSVILTMD